VCVGLLPGVRLAQQEHLARLVSALVTVGRVAEVAVLARLELVGLEVTEEPLVVAVAVVALALPQTVALVVLAVLVTAL